MKQSRLMLALALLLTIALLSACSSLGDDTENADIAPAVEANASGEIVPESAPAGVEFSAGDAGMVLYDGGGLRIVFLGMEKDDDEYRLKLSYENTTDISYDAQSREARVDGLADLVVYSDTIPAGTNSEGSILLPLASLEAAGIATPSLLEANVVILSDAAAEVANIPVRIHL